MTDESPTDPEGTAVETLKLFGLSAYAARTYVALAGLGSGTAKEVSEVSEVPRTRVYDAVEELKESGLVDVQQSSPQRFWPASAETTGRKFERESIDRIETLREALDEVEPVYRREEQRGVWTVHGREAVTDRVVEFVEEAEEEVVYMTVERLLDDDLLEALRRASDRGVAVRVAGLSPSVETTVTEAVPAAETFESLWTWADTPSGRVMMVDGTKTLASAITDGNPSGEVSETAIWGTGEANSLVAILKAIFTWRLDNGEYDPSE
ncbi:TrmB family transcriptional regulator [Halobium salinum]|uniref:TrmB family transcriptional regulator n=1 Tax=Halobium salinum TaxID=1364940 RepID=A0ABD5PAY9_9EURY|nr:helix-turn-helix domain-containing protein [Halobium salinum]